MQKWGYDVSYAIWRGNMEILILVLSIVVLIGIIKINIEINKHNKGLENFRESKKDEKMEDKILGERISAIGRTDNSMTLVFDNGISLIVYASEWFDSSLNN